MITRDGENDLGDCPYFATYAGLPWAEKGAVCSYGCWEEPECVTCEPNGGWPSVHAEINARNGNV